MKTDMAFGTATAQNPSKFSLSAFLGNVNAGEVKELDIDSLLKYNGGNQPFSMYSEDKMNELVESIRVNGLLQPILVQPLDGGKYEILAGHNRVEGCRRAGLERVKSIILENLSEEQAQLVVTDTNLCQREKLKPSERAKAYAMQKSALKKIGRKAPITEMSEQYSETTKTISRYLTLNKIVVPELLDEIDSGRVNINAGAILANLPKEAQEGMVKYLQDDPKRKISESLASKLAHRAREENLIPARKKPEKKYLDIRLAKQYIISSGIPQEKIQNFIVFCLSNSKILEYFLKGENQNDD